MALNFLIFPWCCLLNSLGARIIKNIASSLSFSLRFTFSCRPTAPSTDNNYCPVLRSNLVYMCSQLVVALKVSACITKKWVDVPWWLDIILHISYVYTHKIRSIECILPSIFTCVSGLEHVFCYWRIFSNGGKPVRCWVCLSRLIWWRSDITNLRVVNLLHKRKISLFCHVFQAIWHS